MKKNVIYVTGHRNPDMDSICSAMGYAALKNLTDPRHEYVPVCCSHPGEGLKALMEKLGIPALPYMRDVYPKVSDVMMKADNRLDASASLKTAAERYESMDPPAVPVFDGEKYFGLITLDTIADWTLRALKEGKDLNDTPTVGELIGAQTPPCRVDDLFTDAKKTLQNHAGRGIAVLDRDGNFAGYVTRQCFLEMPHYNVILVDHNEPEQSIRGLETANLCEIIDHHRLNTVKTDTPLFIDAEPLGSTCTIVYQKYLRYGIRPDPKTAKLLLTGILTDTLILRSPTTTRIDEDSADALAAISGVEIDEYGKEIFSGIEGLKTRNPIAAITSDFKRYEEKNIAFGIGQCEVTTLADIDSYAERYKEALETVRRDGAYDWAVLMITDVIKERSVLLSTAFPRVSVLPYQKLSEGVYDMPGVMSRKKQLLPEILHAISE